MINKFINYLQTRSSQTKGQIVALVVTVATIGLGIVWINGVRNGLTGIGKEDLLPNTGTVLSAVNHVTIESLESKNGKKYLYFKVENNTSDILNFPTIENISLRVDDKEINPETLVTRQEQQFVQKILTNTTNYGIMIFPDFDAEDGELTIKEMFFEQSSAKIFKQPIDLDFKALKPLEELRT